MEPLFVLAFLVFLLILMTVIGHGIWVTIRWFIRQLAGSANDSRPQVTEVQRCANCGFQVQTTAEFCGQCGCPRLSGIVVELLKDLRATVRQLERFHRAGSIDDETYRKLNAKIEAEKARLTSRRAPAPLVSTRIVTTATSSETSKPTPEAAPDEVVPIHAPPVIIVAPAATDVSFVVESKTPTSVTIEEHIHPPAESPTPRRPFSEMLAAFMEQSNIRWGEIVGGLLIIGCSTALVVSLWAQISRIPVLKFLIFTTVTAAMFGVGLYTEHRWKLPTTSRGILTIATLLVPLNFLAIAAVSGSTLPAGALVIGSELIAPALFLCLVYFAGRVLTPKWPQLLATAVLGLSVGQLLIRHFAALDNSPELLLALGAFPVVCYLAAAGWMLRTALADAEIDESETNAIFITLGAITFATALPFGLLLYKTGPVGMTMMYLAPLVTLAGVPMLATGTLLRQRVTSKELAASRTAGTSLAIVGTVIVLSGMILAWPNPASIVPAALFNFAVFTALAVLLEIPVSHLLAAGCFGLAYLVSFHVLVGHIYWQNLRVMSLLDVIVTVSSGQALAPLFVLFMGATEWLTHKRRLADSRFYLIAACAAAVLSLLLVTVHGFGLSGDPHALRLVYALYAVGAFWIAWRRNLRAFAWDGSVLLLLALFQMLGPWLGVGFPWQAAMLLHASVCAIAAIVFSQYGKATKDSLLKPLNQSSLITSFLAVLFLVQAWRWEMTAMQSQRIFWLAAIWFVLLWLNRDRRLFRSFQIALTCGLVLAIKATLQQYDWYAYLPHAFLHPTALQIQGTALLLLSLVWVAVRFMVKQQSDKLQFVEYQDVHPTSEEKSEQRDWAHAAWQLLNTRVAFDRLVSWLVLGGFVLLSIYGALSGVKQELTGRGSDAPVWNIAGFPHQEAFALGSWILLGLLVIAMLANLWERRRAVYLLGAVGALATICPLLAGRWETQIATASAWRWIASLFLVMASLPLWFRTRLSPTNFSLSLISETDISPEQRQTEVCRTLARQTRVLLLTATLAPLLALTAYPALRAIYYMPVHGPSSGFFYFLDEDFSYSVPLVIAALVLIGYAVRERLATYAFSAGLLFNLIATMVYLLSVAALHGSMNRVVLAHTIQLNAMTSALYTLVWLGTRKRWLRRLTEVEAVTAERLFKLQITIAALLNVLLIVPITLRVIGRPDTTGIATIEAGSFRGWLAFVLTACAAGWFAKAYDKRCRAGALCTFLFTTGCLVAFTVARWSPAPWAGFHTLMVASAATAWLICLARSLPALVERSALGPVSDLFERLGKPHFTTDWFWDTALFAAVVGALTSLLALRGWIGFDHPMRWSIGTLLAMSALAAMLSWQTLHRGYLYSAQILLSITVTVWWSTQVTVQHGLTEFIEAHVIALSLPSIVWLLLELRSRRLRSAETSWHTGFSFHNFAALGSLLVMAGIVWFGGSFDQQRVATIHASIWLGWMALASASALMIACLWDAEARYPVAGLYLYGLLAVGMALQQLTLSPGRQAWSLTIALAFYAIATTLLWRKRDLIIAGADRLKIPRRLDPAVTELKWLIILNTWVVAVVIFRSLWIDLRFTEAKLRVTASLAVGLQAITFGSLAQGARRKAWQKAAFAMFALGAVFFGWAWLVPGVSGTWLNRAVILMVEMFGVVALFGLKLDKALEREPELTRSVRDCVPWLTGAGIVALAFILGTEVVQQIEFGSVHISLLPLATIALTLVSATVICILFALSPAHDPLNLSESKRKSYVYVAELMVALFFMHIRLTMPWLFTGFFERYWPLLVVAIAYAGIATSELLRRRNVLVLADPIERTGAFLPLLPVMGFWLTQSQVDYSVLLFIVGGLYGVLSILRRSFGFGVLAALAGNGGLWYLWHRTDEYGFLQHPQLWLIPAAMSVLVAAYLNREDFSEEQMIGIRYLTLVTIYASSTADIFINGVARSPWLPMILAALSLTGVFTGIMFRIRALLLLGSVFLLLAVTTMIYYASYNFGWTWLWYVAGIVTGAMIIFTFALFEKKRDEMLRVVEGLKEWQR